MTEKPDMSAQEQRELKASTARITSAVRAARFGDFFDLWTDDLEADYIELLTAICMEAYHRGAMDAIDRIQAGVK